MRVEVGDTRRYKEIQALAHSICAGLHERNHLAGAFFCQRDDRKLNKAGNILPTLIYKLAVLFPPFQCLLAECLCDNPTLTIPSKHNGPGVAEVRKLAVLAITGQNSHPDGHLRDDAMLLVGLLKRLETVGVTDSHLRGQTVLHNKHALLTMEVEVLRVAQLGVRDDTEGLMNWWGSTKTSICSE